MTHGENNSNTEKKIDEIKNNTSEPSRSKSIKSYTAKEIDMINKFFVDKQKEFLFRFKEMKSQFIDKINSN